MINNLGTRLFKSVTDKAGDLGEKFEEEFSRLSLNITAEVDAIVVEAISLSTYIKVALVILCILLILIIIRYTAFGARCLFFKARDWLLANESRPPPQVILLMPTEEGGYRKSSTVYTDQQTKHILNKIQQDSFELFNDSPPRSEKKSRAPRISRNSLRGQRVPEEDV
ncbi:unnamed protein product [Caenorhabditis auriculariae]|uniref:Uncharacterized protein n=1 Tax=Caenorhabditis auriculariae TaxID=2777116 RepID=A0A8S1H6A5_9PELO|nr:unnamed protein product [Caenorhabditis auriculariae]